MKIFEIGDGQTIIKTPSHYYGASENEQTIQLYKGERDDEPVIRISVIYFERVKGVTQKDIITDFKEKATEYNVQAVSHSGKSYFSYDTDSSENLYMHIYEVMYGEHIVAISLTANKGQGDTDEVNSYKKEIVEMIKSIDALSSLEFPLLEPKYEDLYYLTEEVAKVLDLSTEELGGLYESGEVVHILQDILTRRDYEADDRVYYQALGMLFGSCIAYQYEDFHWVVVSDEYGREMALQYRDYAVQCFPISMITKRIEDGEDIDVNYLMEEVTSHIKSAVEKDKQFKVLDYNF